jgi:hypothetical protein
MNRENFNLYLILYQSLTNSFVEIPSHYKDSFYKCYQKKYNIVQEPNLEILKKFENITLTDLYKPEKDISNLPYSIEPYTSMKLCVEEENIYCVYVELGLLIFYYLCYSYQDTIKKFLEILNEMDNEKFVPVKLVDDKIYEIDFYYLKSKEKTFFEIENFDRIFTLFGKSNNSIFHINNNLEFIVEKYRIDNILKYIEKIDFTVFER